MQCSALGENTLTTCTTPASASLALPPPEDVTPACRALSTVGRAENDSSLTRLSDRGALVEGKQLTANS